MKEKMNKTFKKGAYYRICGHIYKMINRGKKITDGNGGYYYDAEFQMVSENENDINADGIGRGIIEYCYGAYSFTGVEVMALKVMDDAFENGCFGSYFVYADKNHVKFNNKTNRYE